VGDFTEFFEDVGEFFTEDIPGVLSGEKHPSAVLGPLGPLGEYFFGEEPTKDDDDVQALIEQGMDESMAIQAAALQRARDLLDPFSAPGRRALEQLEGYSELAGPLSEQALQQFADEALRGPGLTPGEQFQLDENIRALGSQQASRGQFFSGKAGEELLERGSERISAASEDKRMANLATLSTLAPDVQAAIARGAQGAAIGAAGFELGGAQGMAGTQFAGATQIAGLEAQKGGIFGEHTQDIFNLAGLGIDIGSLFV
jgi:hypothetical protein